MISVDFEAAPAGELREAVSERFPRQALASPGLQAGAEYRVWASVFLMILDAAALLTGGALALQSQLGSLARFERIDVGIAAGVTFAIWMFGFARAGLYRRQAPGHARNELYATLAVSAVVVLPLIALLSLFPHVAVLRPTLLFAAAIAVCATGLGRFALRVTFQQAALKSQRIAIVGTHDRVLQVLRTLDGAHRCLPYIVDGVEFVRQCSERDATLSSVPWLRSAFDWKCDVLILTEDVPAEAVPFLVYAVENRGAELALASAAVRPHACDLRVKRIGELPLIFLSGMTACRPLTQSMRRALDLALVVPGLLLIAPLLALIALAIALDSGAPIFYRQVRVGKGGREFRIWKFRSMPANAETQTGPIWAGQIERRSTRVGAFLRRTSLDELPQLFNVLAGEMSLVGPRPERPCFVAQFRQSLPRYDERHLVRPGITGWSHVNMRRNVDVSAISERLRYDLFYLEHWTPLLDASILVKTFAEVLFQRAA